MTLATWPPGVSVIIPVYNGERFLAEAIRSVIDQAMPLDEIIVVDDGSIDNTGELVANLADEGPIHYVFQANQGPAAARNHGLRLARGEIIAFQDADDLWASDRLRLQLQILDRRPEVSLVIGRTCFFFDGTAPELTAPKPVESEDLTAPRWFLSMHCGLYRRTAFTEVGVFDETLLIHDDVDWFRRAVALGLTTLPHDDVVLFHRRHADNLTNNRAAAQIALLRMLRQGSRGNGLGAPLLAALTGHSVASEGSNRRDRT